MGGCLLSVTFLLPSWLKGGEKDMDAPTVEMEVERVMNLVRGFGWNKAKEEIVDDEIHITIKKKSAAAAAAGASPGPS